MSRWAIPQFLIKTGSNSPDLASLLNSELRRKETEVKIYSLRESEACVPSEPQDDYLCE